MFVVSLVITQLLSKCYRSDSVIYSLAVQLSLERAPKHAHGCPSVVVSSLLPASACSDNTEVFVRIRKYQPVPHEVPNKTHDVIKHEIGLKITLNNRPNWADI